MKKRKPLPKKVPMKVLTRARISKRACTMISRLMKYHKISQDEVIQEAIMEKGGADLNV